MFRAAMPEAAIDKNRDMLNGKDEIRLAEYRLIPSPAGDAICTEEFRESNFGVPVAAAPNPRHYFRTLLLCENICHWQNSTRSSGVYQEEKKLFFLTKRSTMQPD